MTREEAEQFYGADATEWLRRWDAGDTVWSIEMGGLSPGYEQCIQITAAEILRWYLANKPNLDDEDAWDATKEARDKAIFALPKIVALGLSGAQVVAAGNLAGHLYRKGPAVVMTDERVKDRHIQVREAFP